MTTRIKHALYDVSCFESELWDVADMKAQARLLTRLAMQLKDLRDWVVREARRREKQRG